VKVADFGLTMALPAGEDSVLFRETTALPVRWIAPEGTVPKGEKRKKKKNKKEKKEGGGKNRKRVSRKKRKGVSV
jgi:hypothetical protein